MPLSLRALSEIRCVGSVLIAIMDQGYEGGVLVDPAGDNNTELPPIRRSLLCTFAHFAMSFTTNLTSTVAPTACLTLIFAKPIVLVSLFEPRCCLRVQTRGHKRMSVGCARRCARRAKLKRAMKCRSALLL